MTPAKTLHGMDVSFAPDWGFFFRRFDLAHCATVAELTALHHSGEPIESLVPSSEILPGEGKLNDLKPV